MPRRSYKKKSAEIDPIYKSEEVAKLINYIMKDGKKTIAQKIIYTVFERFKKDNKDPLQVFHQVIENVAPNHEVKPRRLGGASYLVPSEVRRERRLFLALNWIVEGATSKSNKEYKTFSDKMYAEMTDALNNQGHAIGKKVQTEKLAEANKAFSHLKW